LGAACGGGHEAAERDRGPRRRQCPGGLLAAQHGGDLDEEVIRHPLLRVRRQARLEERSGRGFHQQVDARGGVEDQAGHSAPARTSATSSAAGFVSATRPSP